MDFCHIAPTPHLDLVKNRRACLTLAHLIDENFDKDNYDASYADWYKNNPHKINIMDNSGFELYKTGQMMYPGDQLVDLAGQVNATHIVIPDHPDHPSMVGIDEARRYAPVFKEAGFGTFFVPQSTIGDLEDLLTSFALYFGFCHSLPMLILEFKEFKNDTFTKFYVKTLPFTILSVIFGFILYIFNNELLSSEAPVVIDFHATWCGPCKVLSPILEELSSEVDGVEFVKLDVDQHPEIAGANSVMGVPTVVMLKGGEVKERFVGVQPKEVIKEKVSALI